MFYSLENLTSKFSEFSLVGNVLCSGWKMMDALYMYSACFPLLLSGIAFKIVAADADDDNDGDDNDDGDGDYDDIDGATMIMILLYMSL